MSRVRATEKRHKRIEQEHKAALLHAKFYGKRYVVGKTKHTLTAQRVSTKIEINTQGMEVCQIPAKRVKIKAQVRYKAKAQCKVHLNMLWRSL